MSSHFSHSSFCTFCKKNVLRKSNMATIIEEKLVYGPKDLLAWLGGALGIFVGYSFFDLAKHIIDIAFYFVYKLVSTN